MVFPLIDVVVLRGESSGWEHKLSKLLWKRIRNSQAGGIAECEHDRWGEIHIACAGKLHTVCKQERCAYRQVSGHQTFRAGGRDFALRGLQLWVRGKNRRSNGRDGSAGASPEVRLEDLRCRFPIRNLLKRLHPILLQCAVYRSQQVAIKENAKPSPQRPI